MPPRTMQPRGPNTGASQATVRAHNLALVLEHILDHPARLNRARIATAVGLTRATASDLVDALVSARVVTEVPDTGRLGAGRPGKLLTPAARTHVGVGMEIQADRLSVGALDLTGSFLSTASLLGDFRGASPASIMARLSGLVEPILRDLQHDGIHVVGSCLSVPAILQTGLTVVKLAPNLGWSDVDLAPLAAHDPVLGTIPMSVLNDADLGAMWEARSRARADGTRVQEQSMLYLEGAVGIGGAIVVGGTLSAGQHGWSGEIGHQLIDPKGPQCACGSRGCLETYAGRNAILDAAGLAPSDDLDTLRSALASRERRGVRAVARAADALGIAVSGALNLVDVDRVVLSGTLSTLADHLSERILEHVADRVIVARWVDIRVEPSVSGTDSSLRGAGMRALQPLIRNPVSPVT